MFTAHRLQHIEQPCDHVKILVVMISQTPSCFIVFCMFVHDAFVQPDEINYICITPVPKMKAIIYVLYRQLNLHMLAVNEQHAHIKQMNHVSDTRHRYTHLTR